jgi:hypothetical protein
VKDRHKGETCIIIASGPSLKDVPNEFLESYVTFGVNKIWLKEFSPTYYVAIDAWMNPYGRWMMDMKCREYFLGETFKKILAGSVGTDRALVGTPEEAWEGGGSVIFWCLKLAHLMGFETVLLVGLDHTGVAEHFHPAYEQWGAKRTYNWDGEKVDATFENVNEKYKESGRRIINLTPGTLCEAFEKQDIELWQTHT